jgi:hypothetical protein
MRIKHNARKGTKTPAMFTTKMMAASCASAFLLISALAMVALPASPPPVEASTSPGIDNLTVLHIGGGDLASQVVSRLAEKGVEVVSSAGIPEAVELNPQAVVIFGGEWFEQRIYDAALPDFLRFASSQGASMVMVGGTSSRFFEVLDGGGVYEIPVTETGETRNPSYDSAPMVGLRVKTVDGYAAPSLLFSCTSSPDVLVESLMKWLQSTPGVPGAPAVGRAPYLRFVAEYSYLPLLDSEPYGRLNLTVPIYKLMGDDVRDYDWYLYRVELQSVPGRVAYSSSWVTDCTWAHQQLFEGGADRWLDDYAPTTMYGPTAVDVSLGPMFPRTWTYSIRDVVVLDRSDYSQGTAYWQHDIDQGKPVATNAYLAEPGFVVMTAQDNWSFVDAWYQVRFARPFLWWSCQTHTVGPSPTVVLDAFQAED